VSENSITAGDLDPDKPIYGAEAIAKVVNLTPRQAFYQLENGHLPATKLGARWASTPRRLLAHFNGESAA
jgi:hypothetical protein